MKKIEILTIILIVFLLVSFASLDNLKESLTQITGKTVSGKVLELHFDEGTGNIAYDTSGNNHHGNILGAKWVPPIGIRKNALNFDGIDDYVKTTTLGNFGSQVGSSTISLWVKTTESRTGKTMVGTVNNGYSMIYAIRANSGYPKIDDGALGYTQFYLRDSSGSRFLVGYITDPIYDGKWHHIVWVIDDPTHNSHKVYVDGKLAKLTNIRETSPSSFVNFNNPLTIGALNARGEITQFFNGIIDEVKIYNRALTADEVKSLYYYYTPILIEGIAILEIDDTYLTSNGYLDLKKISKNFHAYFPKEFDFLTIYTTFPVNDPMWHLPTKSLVSGIGFQHRHGIETYDFSMDYGSSKLLGINVMGKVPDYELTDLHKQLKINGVLHETGHQWLAMVNFDDSGKMSNEILQPVLLVHWNKKFDTGAEGKEAGHGGFWWNDNGDGTFTAKQPTSYINIFSNIDLYLMGLLDASSVSPMILIKSEADPTYIQPGDTINGKRQDVTVQQIIKAEGPRRPSVAESQKSFKMAFILLTKPDQPPTQIQLNNIKYIRENTPQRWNSATKGLSTMETNI